MRPSGDHRPPTTSCEQCHAGAWVQRRASWPVGALQWLGSGGTFRPTRNVCRVCGAVGGGSYRTMTLSGAPANRWTAPLRLVRAVVLTVQAERRVEPVPVHYLTAGLIGGVVAGLPAPGRRAPAVMTGVAGGVLACWCGYAATAVRTPGLGGRVAEAALQEVMPGRAEARRRRRDVAQAAEVSFPLYGPVHGPVDQPWDGAGGRRVRVSSQDEVVTSVQLVHGDPEDPTAPWLHVTSSSGHEPPERDEDAVADDLLGRVGPQEPSHADPPQWQHDHLVVDGRSVPARRLEQPPYRSVVAWVDDVLVVVETHDVAATPALARVPDLALHYAP